MASSTPTYTTITSSIESGLSLYRKPEFEDTVIVSEMFSDLMQMCRGLSKHITRVDISESDGQVNIHFSIDNNTMQLMLICEQTPSEEKVVYFADCYIWLEKVKTLFTTENQSYLFFMQRLVELLENHNIARRVYANQTKPPVGWIEENEHVRSWVDISSGAEEYSKALSTLAEVSAEYLKELYESLAGVTESFSEACQQYGESLQNLSKTIGESYPYSLKGLKEDD